ncbi:MAG: hypothetical protein ACW99Q_26430 [Candidatus Kariarchaeaceae archaeon]
MNLRGVLNAAGQGKREELLYAPAVKLPIINAMFAVVKWRSYQ